MRLNDITIDSKDSKDEFLSEIYKLGGSDGTTSFEELRGKSVQTATQPLMIESVQDFAKVFEAIDRYKDLQSSVTTSANGRLLWQKAWKLSSSYYEENFAKDIFGVDAKLYIGKANFSKMVDGDVDNDEIFIPLIRADNGEEYARVVFNQDPNKSAIIYTNGKSQNIGTMPLQLVGIFNSAFRLTNTAIQNFHSPDMIKKCRTLIMATEEEMIKREAHGEYTRDPQISATTRYNERSVTLSERIRYPANVIRGFAKDAQDFECHTAFQFAGHEFNVLSHDPLTENLYSANKTPFEIQRIEYALNLMPQFVKDYYASVQSTQSNETISFALVSADEFRSMVSGPGVAAFHDKKTGIIYTNPDFFNPNLDPGDLANFVHEFCHATFDMMTKDSILQQLSTPAVTKGFGTFDLASQYFPKDYQDALLVTSTGAALIMGGRALVTPIIKFWQISLIIGGGLAVDQMLSINLDEEGLFADEFQKVKNIRASGSISDYDAAVSVYSLYDNTNAEFSCESLLAYLFTQDDIELNGLYVPDSFHGFKTREELAQKQPELFLAFESFFAVDSPQRFSAGIFYDASCRQALDEAMRVYDSTTGSSDDKIALARQSLFRNLPEPSYIKEYFGDE